MDNSIKIKVTVTPVHIKHGMPQKPESCPIAMALKEQHKEFCHVRVGGSRATMSCPETSKNYGAALPLEAMQFVSSFDRGIPVEPFEFTLEFNPIKPS